MPISGGAARDGMLSVFRARHRHFGGIRSRRNALRAALATGFPAPRRGCGTPTRFRNGASGPAHTPVPEPLGARLPPVGKLRDKPAAPTSVTASRMSYMDQPSNPTSALRPIPPTFKEKGALQREVNRLLDALAPERTTTRSDRPAVPIQQHRT